MKKTYITPKANVEIVATEGCLLEGSLLINNVENNDDAWVKADRSAGRSRGERSDYDNWNNVWNDIVNP